MYSPSEKPVGLEKCMAVCGLCAGDLCRFRLPLVVLAVWIVRWQPLLLQTAACMSIPDGALAYPPLWIVTDCPLTRDRVLTAGGTVTDCSIS